MRIFPTPSLPHAIARREPAIELIPVAKLRPDPRNARTHSRRQVRQLAASIREFGFTSPVLIDENRRIIAGHGRVEAARLVGLKAVPCLCLADLSETQKRAYMITDNKLALNAGWDEVLLAEECQSLIELEPEFDISVTGFSPAEIDTLLGGIAPEEAGDPRDDELPRDAINSAAPVSQPGDLWLLGPHRLLCGNATDPASFSRLLGDERARMVFTDPPYNVPVSGHVSGLGAVKHREFPMASGEMSRQQFTDFLVSCLDNLVDVSVDGAIHFVCMDWRHTGELTEAGARVYSELKNLCVWVKDNGGMGSFYRSRHELVFVFKAGSAAHMNNFGLGEHGRYRTNVWEYRGVNTFSKDRNSELAMHPTVKPVSMIADAIMDVSGRGDIVLDAFGGSGSTLIAAHRTGRRARLLELDPGHVDTTIRRFEAWARDDAIHADTGQTFTEVMAVRSACADGHPDDAAQMPDDSLRPANDTADRNAVRKGGSQ